MNKIWYEWLNKNFNIDKKYSDELYYFIIDYNYEIIKIENNFIYLYDLEGNKIINYECKEYINLWIDEIEHKIDIGVSKNIENKWTDLINYLKNKIL